nr:hypothetical protein [Tanacetum cinerariifolium]
MGMNGFRFFFFLKALRVGRHDLPSAAHLLSGGRLSSRAAERSLVESFCWIFRLMLLLETLLVDTDNELEPEEVSSETDDSQPLGSRVPLMGEEFTAFEPSVRKRYRGTSEIILDTDSEGDELGEEDTKKDESLDTNDEREMSKDVGPGLEGRDEETVPEVREDHVPSTFEVGQRSRSVPEHDGVERVFVFRQPILDTWIEFKDGRVYIDIPAYVPPVAPVQTPPSLEWSSGSLPISPSSLVVLSPIASPVATPIATISVDEDQFLEVGAQLELHGSILHDHT